MCGLVPDAKILAARWHRWAKPGGPDVPQYYRSPTFDPYNWRVRPERAGFWVSGLRGLRWQGYGGYGDDWVWHVEFRGIRGF